MVVTKVAIVGCGVGGLAAIKSCLDAGLQPTCFEQQSWLGGIWNYTDAPRPNMGSVHAATITNISKAMMCFSDFPMPKEYPNYMPHPLFQKYLEMYAKHFDLERYVWFDTKVVRLSKSRDHSESGGWTVAYARKTDGNEIEEEASFDAVMICIGQNWKPNVPEIPGMEKFKGVLIHSGDYRTLHPYVGKKVVVVGCGFSSGDIASELSRHASQVYMSSKNGAYFVKRLVPGTTKPFDHQLSRAQDFFESRFQINLLSGFVNREYDLAKLDLQPTGILGVSQFPIVNDDLPLKIICGRVIVKGEIKELRGTSVVFDGEDVLEDVDAVIFGTGFKLGYPFASDVIHMEDEHYTRLYKQVFLPDAEHQTLAVIGAAIVVGPFPLVWEMQTRVAAAVFTGSCVLPSKDVMLSECVAREELLTKIGRPREKFLNGFTFVHYTDELSDMIGATPNLWSIFKENPKLAYQCFFGPNVPAQYRLQGSNSWKDARKVIKSTEEDYLWPLKTRKGQPFKVQSKSYFYHVLAVVFVALLAIFLHSIRGN